MSKVAFILPVYHHSFVGAWIPTCNSCMTGVYLRKIVVACVSELQLGMLFFFPTFTFLDVFLFVCVCVVCLTLYYGIHHHQPTI